MKTQSQQTRRPVNRRGRTVEQRSNQLRLLYVVGGIIALVLVAVIGTVALQNRQSAPTSTGVVSEAITLPTGKTNDGFFYKGNADAPVTVVEYSDFQCPSCAYYATQMAADFDRDYIATGKVKLVYHDFPLSQHVNAVPSAEAARCAGDQGVEAFWGMHNMLFANQRQWENLQQPAAQFGIYAGQLKLDQAAFNQCLTNNTHQSEIQSAQQQGMQIQIPGTPTFIVADKQVDANGLRQAVDTALSAQGVK